MHEVQTVSLLIVLNGIEITIANHYSDQDYLLIVLNGIEIRPATRWKGGNKIF